MAITADEVERKLAADIMEYLAVAESEDHTLRTMRSGPVLQDLGWLLEDHLEGQEGYPFGIGIDRVDPGWFGIRTFPLGLEFYGYAMWYRDGKRMCVDPFAVRVQVAPAGDFLAEYRLEFGDARRGLGHIGWGRHAKEIEKNRPEKWLFTFTKELSSL
jgi:hypothetical protein